MHSRKTSRLFLAGVMSILVATAASAGTVYQLSESNSGEHPSVAGCRRFAELVSKATDGRISIDVQDNEALFSEIGSMEAARRGSLAFCRVNARYLADSTYILGVLSFPYIFEDEGHFWKVLNGEIGEAFLLEMKDDGLIGLVYYDAGARSFYNRRREINAPNRMRGLRFGVQQNQLMMGLVAALGAHPSPVVFEKDIYFGLKTELLDGAENTCPGYFASGDWEIAGYCTLDRHTRTPDVLCISRQIWESLSEADREVVKKAALESQDVQRDAWKEYESNAIKGIAEKGSIVMTEILDIEEWRAAVAPLRELLYFGPGGEAYLKRIAETK